MTLLRLQSTAETTPEVDSARFTIRMAYDGSNNLEYVGQAAPGTSESAAKWSIRKLIYSGSLNTKVLWADGNSRFDNVWTDYSSLTYS